MAKEIKRASMKKIAALAEQLDGAKLVKYDANSGLTFAWYGGTGVNIYDETGYEVDFFTFGYENKNPEYVSQLISEHIAEMGNDVEGSKKTATDTNVPEDVKARLEYLRKQIEDESISYGEIAELESLVDYIDSGDVQLLEWAGMPEDEYRDTFGTKKGSTEKKADSQGDRNYETSLAHMWVSSDRETAEKVKELFLDVKEDFSSDDPNSYSSGTVELAKKIQDLFEREDPIASDHSVYSDLLHAAISEVDFRDVAESVADMYKEAVDA